MRLEVIHEDGSKVVLKSKAAPPPVQWYRHPHDIELIKNTEDRRYRGDGDHSGTARQRVLDSGMALPQVFRMFPDQTVPLSCGFIRLWRDCNDWMTLEQFCLLLDNHLWLTNRTGWPGRYNCLTGEDAGQPNPSFHASLVCGGKLFRGEEAYSLSQAFTDTLATMRAAARVRSFTGLRRNIVSTLTTNNILKIKSILTSDPVPTAAEVLADPALYFYGTQVNPDGVVTYISRKDRNGVYRPVVVPFITKYPVYLPLSYLDKLPLGFVPSSPLWMAERG